MRSSLGDLKKQLGKPRILAAGSLVALVTLGGCCGLLWIGGSALLSFVHEFDKPVPNPRERISVSVGPRRESDARVWLESEFAALTLPAPPVDIWTRGRVQSEIPLGTPSDWNVQMPEGHLTYHMRVRQVVGENGTDGSILRPWQRLAQRVVSERRNGELVCFATRRISGFPALELIERPFPRRNPNSFTHEMIVIIASFEVTIWTATSRYPLPTSESRRILNSLYFDRRAISRMKESSAGTGL